MSPRLVMKPLRGLLIVSTVSLLSGAACATAPRAIPAVPQAQARPSTSGPLPSKTTAIARLEQWAKDNRCQLSLTVSRPLDANPWLDRAGEVPRNPASVTKILTARVALEVLGPSFQFKTGILGTMADGHAKYLVLRSDGDPTLTVSVLRDMVADLVAQGLSQVDEEILVDQNAFSGSFVPPAFEQQPDEWAAFRAPICATPLDHNKLTIRVVPSKANMPAQVLLDPPGYASISGHVQTVAKSDPKHPVVISVAPLTDVVSVTLDGTIGESAGAKVTYKRVEDPRRLAGLALRALLLERSVRVPPRVVLQTTSTSDTPTLVERRSEPLSVILRGLGKDSDNFTAEMLLRAVAKALTGTGSSPLGASALLEHLSKLGTVEAGTKILNGSGLFDANRLSTRAIVRVLSEARKNQAIYPEFAAQLSVAGLDGTLRHRFQAHPEGCTIRAKTGTLRAVNAIAGYVDAKSGVTHAFSVIVEGEVDSTKLKTQLDAFVASLCDEG